MTGIQIQNSLPMAIFYYQTSLYNLQFLFIFWNCQLVFLRCINHRVLFLLQLTEILRLSQPSYSWSLGWAWQNNFLRAIFLGIIVELVAMLCVICFFRICHQGRMNHYPPPTPCEQLVLKKKLCMPPKKIDILKHKFQK